MDQLITFIPNHLMLFAALVIILGLLIHNLLGTQLSGFGSLSPSEATMLINRKNAVVLDVREDAEYKTGHILNSIHIPQSALKTRMGELEKHKNKPIIVGCRSGNRSGPACAQLKKQGFETVHNLKGGIMGWQNANLPLVKE